MKLRHLLLGGLMALWAGGSAQATTYDSGGYPVMYLVGKFCNWQPTQGHQFERQGNTYSVTVESLSGEFKISDDSWTIEYGLSGSAPDFSGNCSASATKGAGNFNATTPLTNVTISFDYNASNTNSTTVHFTFAGGNGGGDDPINPVEPTDGKFLYFQDSNVDWNPVYVYVWLPNQGDLQVFGPWDAKKAMTQTTINDQPGWKVELPDGYDYTGAKVIFHGNTQTGNLDLKVGGLYNKNGYVSQYQEGPVGPIDPPVFDPDEVEGLSGTLPVIYINVYNASGNAFDNEIISPNLAHKNYFNGSYWLDTKGCQWLEELGAANIGSADEPLPLEIKARGNYTRKGFSKKPFKLKLGAKQSMLGLTKSKHFALLAHADDEYGYMRNFTGFNLGKRMGLPWTPWQQPVEVVINGDYRGLYFLTESIRVEKDRINITELDDNDEDATIASGGYLVELDNYPDEAVITLRDASNGQDLYITPNTPEEYSDIQKRFVNDQFTAMNNAVGARSDELWKYMDLDDAARYYLVEEIISHFEAYHGSTYLFRDRGEGQKWHFSPLWDCGHAFDGQTNHFFYQDGLYGNTWITGIRQNDTFNQKVRETWQWFMSNKFDGLFEELDAYASRLTAAAQADYDRWNGVPTPTNNGSEVSTVVDNRNMSGRLSAVKNHLNQKINFLKGVFGNYDVNNPTAEPARDETPAVDLPDYIAKAKAYTFYFQNKDNWAHVNAHVYDDNHKNANAFTGAWPSQEMEFKSFAGGSYYVLTFYTSAELQNPVVIFTNNGASETAHFDFIPGALYGKNGMIQGADFDPNEVRGISGTLPVIYINVKTEDGNFNNEIISPNLDHKNYFAGEYWLDTNGCEWLEELGATNLGSSEAPLPLEIKARGNYTRKGFSKKPFKLKLGAKQNMLGLSKSKHFALLAHADDEYGYMRNFTGFNLGKRMGLPWTPWQQPVEVVINGDYRGLYFLTESIRVEKDRINITELDDNADDPTIASGGYLVELDNYIEDALITMPEAGNYGTLAITPDTPEEYSAIQKRFVTDQFTAMNNAVGSVSDELWKYMDIDDAARYYLVEEIISHYEAYHGSTYLFRDRGEGQKWHFSPLWDCGHAFDGQTNHFFYQDGLYGNTWIAKMRQNATFNQKVNETWQWFMSNKFDGLFEELDAYAARLTEAAQADYDRWNGVPTPTNNGSEVSTVVDNRNMSGRLAAVKSHLNQKINFLKGVFGNYDVNNPTAEPARDETPAAPLPSYLANAQVYKVYYSNTGNWGEVYAYHWDDTHSGNNAYSGGWPGTKLSEQEVNGKKYFVYTFYTEEEPGDDMQIIFTNNAGGKTEDLAYVPGAYYTMDGKQVSPSGSLPVLYINVYNEDGSINNDVTSYNLNDKLYRAGEYWLDMNGCEWMEGENIGSPSEPLPLEIKARGNYTRTGFSKKPFKLKLGAKQSMLGLSKSKHFAILAHADDGFGYMRNFTGFNLGKRIGLPWTPWQQPVEVVINGDYRGLYFLTESIRVEKDRVNIEDLDDDCEDNTLISGGYLVELDNYDEENQIQMEEQSCVEGHSLDMLRITWDTPESYSPLQQRFIREQFTAMNKAVGENSDMLWSYIDLDDAVRYYLVEEIISHWEAYHGSTYLFRDRGEYQKWHFSPLWDCGNAFNGETNAFFYDCDRFGNTWIPSMRQNAKFNRKLQETWMWFMTNKYAGLEEELSEYAAHLKSAAKADLERWQNAPVPANGQRVVDNTDMDSRLASVLDHLNKKTSWLRTQEHFGDYTALAAPAAEPARDTTLFAALPRYALEPVEEDVHTIYYVDPTYSWVVAYCYVHDPNPGEPVSSYTPAPGMRAPRATEGIEHLGSFPGTPMEPALLNNQWVYKTSFTPSHELSDQTTVRFSDGTDGNASTPKTYYRNAIYTADGAVTGVEGVVIEAADDVRYYDLQGVRVEHPVRGEFYIRVRNGQAEKLRL